MHCSTVKNQAYLGLRGVLASQLKDSELWWQGPPRFSKEESKWPANQNITYTQESQEEVKKETSVTIVGAEVSPTIAKSGEH